MQMTTTNQVSPVRNALATVVDTYRECIIRVGYLTENGTDCLVCKKVLASRFTFISTTDHKPMSI